MERLIDDLWDEAPPSGAGRALETKVSRLRAALGSGAPITPRARAATSSTSRPRASTPSSSPPDGRGGEAGADDPAAAHALFAEALALWKGEALGGVPDGLLRAERGRLDKRRLRGDRGSQRSRPRTWRRACDRRGTRGAARRASVARAPHRATDARPVPSGPSVGCPADPPRGASVPHRRTRRRARSATARARGCDPASGRIARVAAARASARQANSEPASACRCRRRSRRRRVRGGVR